MDCDEAKRCQRIEDQVGDTKVNISEGYANAPFTSIPKKNCTEDGDKESILKISGDDGELMSSSKSSNMEHLNFTRSHSATDPDFTTISASASQSATIANHPNSNTQSDNLRPILVGYAFGPKKMSTMGLVMAEASKAVSTVMTATTCKAMSMPITTVTASVPLSIRNQGYSPENNKQKTYNFKRAYTKNSSVNTPSASANTNNIHKRSHSRSQQSEEFHSNFKKPRKLLAPLSSTPSSQRSNSPLLAPMKVDETRNLSEKINTIMDQTPLALSSTKATSHDDDDNDSTLSITPSRNISCSLSHCSCNDNIKNSTPDFESISITSEGCVGNGNILFNISTGPGGNAGGSNGIIKNMESNILDISGHNEFNNIIRIFRSSCSSAASIADSSISTTASSLALPHKNIMGAGTGTGTGRSTLSFPQNLQPIRVSFVPLDLDSPLEEQHGGKFDAILHKITEDILCLSQLELNLDENGNIFHRSKQRNSDCSNVIPNPMFDKNELSIELDETEELAVRRVERLTKYKKNHPSCCLVDHPKNVQALMSRADIASILSKCLVGITTRSGIPVRTPRFEMLHTRNRGRSNSILSVSACNVTNGKRDLNCNDNNLIDDAMVEDVAKRIDDAPFTYPLIVKPLTAAGTVQSHRMIVVLGRKGLRRVHSPCLLQEYANHDGQLYKVYVLGDMVRVFPRPSLPNLPIGECSMDEEDGHYAYVEFDSQRPYPKLSDFGFKNEEMSMSGYDYLERIALCNKRNSEKNNDPVSKMKRRKEVGYEVTSDDIRPVVDTLRKAFGLELFGFDILVTCKQLKSSSNICEKYDKELVVVDVNYFPSYKEVTNFSSLLAQYLAQRAIEGRVRSFEWSK